MKITPLGNKVYTISLSRKTESETPKKGKKGQKGENVTLKLDNELFLNKTDTKLFRSRYKVLVSIDGRIDINLVYDFDFKADEDVDVSLAKSLIVRSQIPTYAYPYIKSYLEHFLMMSGYGRAPLPFIDFVESPIPMTD
ncbi:TPA: hypothetical protein UL433_004962 [Klebsiella pneumoniae]|uniref:hypothetical protein n=1 Tax=Klebsiella pneumoniae complex TaxID=3390273 RepID=UPI000E34DB25|nr:MULTISPECIES: hypothetical protein [Klebsiella]AYY32885.1 hypothetical protein EGX99_12595 [Klebsiella pneumoniae]EKZ5562132.1 hypothetical protein [Klebsiella pneumoniae]EKZ5703826.1 hypothetical protein [Klebsiella pneumoniae]EKZ6496033.1 hypothetical protein [Klebsiella pneumoniae]ELA2508579.1 hypothetical protein [Klebsiella pneumoniae]